MDVGTAADRQSTRPDKSQTCPSSATRAFRKAILTTRSFIRGPDIATPTATVTATAMTAFAGAERLTLIGTATAMSMAAIGDGRGQMAQTDVNDACDGKPEVIKATTQLLTR